MKKNDYLERILNARVYDVAIETPLELAAESLARGSATGSAQARGHAAGVLVQAARRLQQDGAARRPRRSKRGVIAASAGNHAQGVALAAQKLGCSATIVMPVTTPQIKVDGGRRRAARKSCCTATPTTKPTSTPAMLERKRRPHLRPSLRRPRRDRGAGHDRHGDPAPARRGPSTRSSCRSAAAG